MTWKIHKMSYHFFLILNYLTERKIIIYEVYEMIIFV